MLGIAFGVLCLLSVVTALFTGNMAGVSEAVLSGAERAVGLIISLCGMSCLWCGFLEVMRGAGAIGFFCRVFRPLLSRLFPGESPAAVEAASAGIVANLLGIGNAATPFCLRAMEEMQKTNPDKSRATDGMIMLTCLSCSSLTLVPTTLITLRKAGGSLSPTAILIPVWIVSGACTLLSVLLCMLLRKKGKRRRKEKKNGSD